MERPSLERLLHSIAGTADEEMSCTECFDAVAMDVDREVAGQDVEHIQPQLQQHLQQCGACREEYEILQELVRLDAEGRAPSTDDLRRFL